MNLLNALSQGVVLSVAESDERNADLDGTSIDVQDYEGVGAFILNSGAGTGTTPTLDCKLQDSADDSSFADVTGATWTQVTDAAALVEVLKINVSNLRRYVKIVGTVGGSTPVFVYGAEFLGIKKAVSS